MHKQKLKFIRDIGEFDSLINLPKIKQRIYLETQFGNFMRTKKKGFLYGYCEVCSKITRFSIDWENFYGKSPNFRERLICPKCGLNNRQRFVASILRSYTGKLNTVDIFCYEQVTGFFQYVKAKIKNARVCGSEYLGADIPPGKVIDGIRHEDALNLSFENDSLDFIVSNDVFEHVPDIELALSEAYRVLRNKGILMISVPFFTSNIESRQRAIIKNGSVIHLLPEQYHGNPISSSGSLVFYDFGWDLLDKCKQAGFADTYMLAYYSFLYGYIGNGLQYIFLAIKEEYREEN